MAKAVSEKRPAAPRRRAAAAPRPTLAISSVNAMWLGAGVVVIAAGYLLLARGMTTLPAILLVLGYLVLLPIGIIRK